MSNPTFLFRSLLTYGIIVPIALFLGYQLTQLREMDIFTFAVIGSLFMILMAPLFLKYYHPWLLATWNMSAVLFFLPGNPQLWMAMTAIGLLIALFQYILSREHKVIAVPSILWPLFWLALVVVITAKATGGIGLRSFGSQVYGGKRYFMIVLAILGFMAICSRRIPPHKAYLYVALFFLGNCTMAIGSLAGLIPNSFMWLFLVFPVESLSFLSNVASPLMSRSWGLALLSLGIFCAMLAKYGVRGVLDLQHPHRFVLLVLVVFIGLLGGFRSILIIYMLTVAVLLYLEGMLRTRVLPAILLSVILGGALLTIFATSLPLSVQRTLAFLPIRIDPVAKLDAQASSEWRVRMWQNVLPEIPQHFWLGKGYSFSSTDDFMTRFGNPQEGYQGSQLVSDFHNGPLSIIVPFGIGGVITFLWFIYAAWRLMYRNYRYSPPEFQMLNTFLYAYFVGRVIFFFGVFGSLYSDLALFTGLLGVSVSLNGGMLGPKREAAPQFAFPGTSLPTASRFPANV